MPKDPYQSNMLKSSPYYKKSPVVGKIVVVLKEYLENRGLELIYPKSRVVNQHEVHEVIMTDEDVQPGNQVNRIAYLCFVEITSSGVILRGDEVRVNGERIGEICGYDEAHMPNHINLVIKADKFLCGKDLGLQLNSIMEIVKTD